MPEEQKPWHEGGFWDAVQRGRNKIHGWVGDAVGDSESKQQQRADLFEQGGQAGSFANTSQGNFGALGADVAQQRARLEEIASGRQSLSGEQLRQGLQQNLAAQRSMAASAAPRDASMAGRTAAMNAGRMGAGMSGQAAMAGMQERRDANSALANLLMQQRQQELQGALGSRQTAVGAYQGITPEQSKMEQRAGMFGALAGGIGSAMSDRNVKEDIQDGDKEAERVLKGLKAYSYSYRDQKHGKGRQFGPMAQDMEKAGLGHAVFETPSGKAVDGAKAALSGLALTAALAKRVSKLEKGK